jgi:hypothetical protein
VLLVRPARRGGWISTGKNSLGDEVTFMGA